MFVVIYKASEGEARTPRREGNAMFYAEFCPFGTKTISDGDTLMGFDSRDERDEMVERLNADGDDRAQAVTVREVSHRYDVRKFRDDPFCDYCHEVNGLRTCKGKPVFEVSHRPGYEY